MANELTRQEKSRLAELEAIIAKGVKTFAATGQALIEVNASKLYKQEYSSFDLYCKERWSLSKSRAYQLIEGAKVIESVHNCGHNLNEAQARELGKVPEEKRGKVLKEASKAGPPTAKKVAKAAAEILPGPEVEAEEVFDIPALAEPYKLAARQLDGIRRNLKASYEDPDERKHVESFYGRVDGYLHSARTAINQATPAKICPRCDGDGCNTCQQSGYWTKQLASSRKSA